MCHENDALNERLSEGLLDCKEEKRELKDDLNTWIDALEELSEIEDAFKTNEQFKIRGKTILDVGTDCVKPLYIALKYKPQKIIGIDEELSYSYASGLEQKSKLFSDTEIRFYSCSFFDIETLNRILRDEKMEKKKFDFVLVSKTLHHLRTAKKCVAKERDEKHECLETEKCCINGFETKEIFKTLLKLGTRVIIYEWFDPNEEDDDKVRGRGGYFTKKEWMETLKHLSDNDNYNVRFIRPEKFPLNEETFDRIEPILRKVDCICFYVEEHV